MADETSAELSSRSTVVERIKDDNGFIFYKCRFCGLTYNYLTTLRAHERVHNVEMVSAFRNILQYNLQYNITIVIHLPYFSSNIFMFLLIFSIFDN